MPTQNELNTLFDMLAGEGLATPKAVGNILAAREMATDLASVKAAARARLDEALAAGDAEGASRAVQDFALLPSENWWPLGVSTTIENATATALLAAFDVNEAYSFLASKYNDAGSALGAAIKEIDPDAADKEVVKLSSLVKRTAWSSVPDLAATLDRLRAEMTATLRDFANVDVRVGRPFDNPRDGLALCVKYDAKLAPALIKVWERRATPGSIYEDARKAHGGRGGLWQDIVKAGGTIEAPTTPDAFTPWPSPEQSVPERLQASTGSRMSAAASAHLADAHAAVVAREAAEAAAAPVIEEPVSPHDPKLGTPGLTAPGALRAAAGLKQ